MKRLLSAILAFAMILSLTVAIATVNVSASADAGDGTPVALFAGDGTENNPYLIETAEQLKLVQTLVTEKKVSGVYFKLANDIDLGGEVWLPMSNGSSAPFNGHFDGDHKTISNFIINANDPNGNGWNAPSFFGILVGATVKDLTLSNATIEGVADYLAAVAGVVKGASTVDGVVVDSTVTLRRLDSTKELYLGGIAAVAEANSKILNCVNAAKIEFTTSKIDQYNGVGGIVANLKGGATVENCVNFSDINAGTTPVNVGGIVGVHQNCAIKNVINFGNITATAGSIAGDKTAYVGGISGRYFKNGASMENAFNFGKVSAEEGTYAGTIIGWQSESGILTSVYSVASEGVNAIGLAVDGKVLTETNVNASATADEIKANETYAKILADLKVEAPGTDEPGTDVPGTDVPGTIINPNTGDNTVVYVLVLLATVAIAVATVVVAKKKIGA